MTRMLGGFIGSLYIGLASLALIACSTSSEGDPTDGGGDTAPAASSYPSLATGTCSLASESGKLEMSGYATMNGAGNLSIECASGASRLGLRIGNGTFVGPGKYEGGAKLYAVVLEALIGDRAYRSKGGDDPRVYVVANIAPAPDTDEQTQQTYLAPKGSVIAGSYEGVHIPELTTYSDGVVGEPNGKFADVIEGAFKLIVR